jgi:hypothetical protein
MSNTEILNSIEANDGQVTPEQGAALLNAELYGDTAPAETVSVPATNPEQETDTPADAGKTAEPAVNTEQQPDPEPAKVPGEDEQNADNTVVLAKDGKHTIPFESLQSARDQNKQLKQQLDEANAKLAAHQAPDQSQQTQQNAATAEALIQASGNDADVIALFGDFSEEALAKGVNALINQRVSAQVEAAVQQALAPIQQQQQQMQQLSAEQQHFATIESAHPDYESIAESSEFATWMDSQPSITRNAFNNVLQGGSAQDVNELLSLYKSQNNVNQAAPAANPTAEMIAKAKQAVQNAPKQIPISVSDLPAGAPAALSAEERLSTLSGPELLLEMQNWSGDKVDEFLARRG